MFFNNYWVFYSFCNESLNSCSNLLIFSAYYFYNNSLLFNIFFISIIYFSEFIFVSSIIFIKYNDKYIFIAGDNNIGAIDSNGFKEKFKSAM